MPRRQVKKPSLDTLFLEGKKWISANRHHENYRVRYSAIMERTKTKILAAPDRDEKNLVGNSLHAVYTEVTGHSPFDFEPSPIKEEWTKKIDKPDYKLLADALLENLRAWKKKLPTLDEEAIHRHDMIEGANERMQKEISRSSAPEDLENLRDIGILI